MTGPQALEAYKRALALVAEGRYEEALAVEMLPSDRKLMKPRIRIGSFAIVTTNKWEKTNDANRSGN